MKTTQCDDRKCPVHGQLKVALRRLTGEVSSSKMRNTVNVKRTNRILLPKYERYAKRYYSLKAHNPQCIGAKEGDQVTVAACRPLSKSKHFVVISKKSVKKVI